MWTTLNFRGRGKTKKTARDIYKRTLDIEFERDRSIGLGSTIGDGQTDRQTQTQTHTFLNCGSDVEPKIIEKSKSNFLTIAILPSLLMSLESKKTITLGSGNAHFLLPVHLFNLMSIHDICCRRCSTWSPSITIHPSALGQLLWPYSICFVT